MKRICKLCGLEFETNRSRQVYCNRDHYKICEICNKEFKLDSKDDKRRTICHNEECIRKKKEIRYKKAQDSREKLFNERYGVCNPFCLDSVKDKIAETNIERYGNKCVLKNSDIDTKRRQTNIDRYGSENPFSSDDIKKRIVSTNIDRYGVANPSNSTEIQDKRRSTFIERYGVNTPWKSDIVQDKIRNTVRERYNCDYVSQNDNIKLRAKKTWIDRYGTDNPSKCDSIKLKKANTCYKNYGVDNPLKIDSVRLKSDKSRIEKYGSVSPFKSKDIQRKSSDTIQDRYGVPYACMTEQCINAHGSGMISKLNKDFKSFLSDIGIDSKLEYHIPESIYSYDVRISDTNILFELNPTYTHNSTVGTVWDDTPLNTEYHMNKTLYARGSGYRCINIFDWDDWNKIVGLIIHDRKIYARECIVKIVDADTSKRFINDNHLQGYCRGNNIRLGLYYNNELVQIMTFGKPRYNKKYQYELIRLCTKIGSIVIGGAEKLFKYFINSYNPTSIISYCDMSKFNGDIYYKLGFDLWYVTDPSCIWSKYNKHITDNLLRQRGYDQLFNTNYGKGTSNRDLMIENGWREVYDCGQGVFTYKRM